MVGVGKFGVEEEEVVVVIGGYAAVLGRGGRAPAVHCHWERGDEMKDKVSSEGVSPES